LRCAPRWSCLPVVCVLGVCALGLFAGVALASGESAKAQLHAEKGLRAAESGDLESAEAELRQAVGLSPADPFILGSLGVILGRRQKLQESNAFFQRALQSNPDDSSLRYNLASNQFQLGQSRLARENLERVLRARPGDRATILLLGMVLEDLKVYSEAARLLSSVPELVSGRSASVVALTRAYYHTNQRDQARQSLRSLLDLPAAPVEAVFLGAKTAAEAGDFETAERLFQSIVKTYPDKSKLGYNLALVQFQAKRIPDSQATLVELVRAGHQSSEVFNLLAWCHHRQNYFEEAVAAMDQAIALDPSRESNYIDLCTILIAHQRFLVAYEAVKKSVEVAPNSFQGYRLKSWIEAKLNYRGAAVATWSRAVELNPSEPEAILGLGRAQWIDGRSKEAAATFEKAINLFPRDARLHQEYGRMLLSRGESGDFGTESRAILLLRTAISLDGLLADSYYELGNLALNKDNPREALGYIETAAKLEPASSKVHYALARAYRRLGRNDEYAREIQAFQTLKAHEDKSNDATPSTVRSE